MRYKGAAVAACLFVAASMSLVACSSGSSSSSGGSKAGANARGPITFVTGKDNSGIMPFIADTVERRASEREGHHQAAVDQADQQRPTWSSTSRPRTRATT